MTPIPNFRLIKCTSHCNYHPHCRGSPHILPSPLSDSEFGKDDDGRASCETSKKWCGGGGGVRRQLLGRDGVFLSSLPPTPTPLALRRSLLGICQREVQCPFRARPLAALPSCLSSYNHPSVRAARRRRRQRREATVYVYFVGPTLLRSLHFNMQRHGKAADPPLNFWHLLMFNNLC